MLTGRFCGHHYGLGPKGCGHRPEEDTRGRCCLNRVEVVRWHQRNAKVIACRMYNSNFAQRPQPMIHTGGVLIVQYGRKNAVAEMKCYTSSRCNTGYSRQACHVMVSL